jgi:hypothetical protein
VSFAAKILCVASQRVFVVVVVVVVVVHFVIDSVRKILNTPHADTLIARENFAVKVKGKVFAVLN